MHEFHINVKGLMGLLLFLASVVLTIAGILLLPAGVLMVVWNAIVFEGFRGPEVNLLQGILLWLMLAVALKVVFKPSFEFQMNAADPQELQSFMNAYHISEATEEEASLSSNLDSLAEQPVKVRD